jgi:hypothetical protein
MGPRLREGDVVLKERCFPFLGNLVRYILYLLGKFFATVFFHHVESWDTMARAIFPLSVGI